MHWRYEWVAELPADVYAELVAMLTAETARAEAPPEDAPGARGDLDVG